MEGYNQVLEQTVWERTAELQNSKEHVETILNSVGDALMVMAPDGLIKQVNPEFERQTGCPADEAIFHLCSRLLLMPGSPRQIFERAATAMRAGQGWRGQIVVGRCDGTNYDADVTISPLRAPTGEISAFVSSLRDIQRTERHRTDEGCLCGKCLSRAAHTHHQSEVVLHAAWLAA